MHELGIASEAYRLCRARVPGPGPMRLVRVRLAVGELTAVEPELLRYAWEAVTGGGPDEHCALEVEWCPCRQVCTSCGAAAERPTGSWVRACPRCGRPLRIEGGEELDILHFEAEPIPEPKEVGT
jgi:hydrogenase nickel incorporation protein HypA/HybF